ncbi:MAG: FAD-dependent oxidoreductase [Methylobacteriaceae bacterium]|nr:FAD-dependent oxidoreductase [Methylobacteriaceae bacterium]
MSARRVAGGSAIDRSREIAFTFDRRPFRGYAGDTLASALLAQDELLIARSFKLHRPRGVFGAGYDDAVMVDRLAPRPAANQLATVTAIEDGAAYRSVSTFPDASRDLGALAQFFAPLLPAGFYYKTFMRPNWRLFEPFVRAAAGLGSVPQEAWRPVCESRFGDCELLIAGAGPAGLAAALTAAQAGAETILVDDGDEPGGRLSIDCADATGWVNGLSQAFTSLPNLKILRRSTVWALHEHNLLAVLERAPRDGAGLDFRNWKIRARQVLVATGAHERGLLFADNDRPGIMLASAARSHLMRHGVLCGERILVCTNNDSAYGAAVTLAAAGADVAIVDTRSAPAQSCLDAAKDSGVDVLPGSRIVAARGRRRVSGADIMLADGRSRRIACDLIAVSGGWNPAYHLASQSRRATSVWNDEISSFVARCETDAPLRVAGAAAGVFAASDCAADGAEAARSALLALGRTVDPAPPPELADAFVAQSVAPSWPQPGKVRGKTFVDLSGDVTTADLALALREGYDSIELVKRYTTAGMGVDQGKTGNVNVIGVVAAMAGKSVDAVGVTTFRPPYAPVEFGAIAGQRRGARLYPWRHTPLTRWHLANGAVMYEAGLRWQRPGYYSKPGENWEAAAQREARAVREAVGVYDGAPLGKLLIKGPDAAALLDLVYVGDFGKLRPGRGKYGVMMSDDGLVLDDGVTFRLNDREWLLHASTGAADRVYAHLEQVLQIHRPHWRVSVIPVTSQWANVAICGPRAREALACLDPDFDISRDALPFMGMAEGRLGDIPVRVFRVSWTGEASFELNTPARHAEELWRRVMTAGAPFGIAPVGSEANHILRVEAGYISIGHEVDGTADVYDLGLGAIVSRNKTDFIGKRAMEIRRRTDPVRPELVGFLPDDPQRKIPEGAPIVPIGGTDQEGFVSACVASVALGRVVALGLLRDGRARRGQTVHAHVRGETIALRVVDPVFHDADRQRVKS